MLAIYKREVRSYFRSFLGFLFVAVTLFFIGLYFSVYNLMNGYPYFSYTLTSVTFLFMLTVPVLTMRILAEEKRSKTDQLILTAPVSVGGIVWGKFLALLTIFAVPVAISCLYPLIMAQFGTVPLVESYLAILGYFLFGMTAIAIGLFISSLTESQVIAAVLTFLFLFLGYMMSSICSLLSSDGNLLTSLLSCYDLYTPFAYLINGVLDLSSIVYYLSVTALMLFLTVQSIQKRRYSISVKSLSFSAYSSGMIVLAVALVVVVNFIMGELPSSWFSVDMTSEQLYSLTDTSIEYVENMTDDVTIYVLSTEDSADSTLSLTLTRYDDLSDHITVEYVDPTVNPMFAAQYTSDGVTTNSLIVVSDKRSKVIDYNDIYEVDYEMDYTTYSYTTTTTGYDGEGQITSALDYVTADDMSKVYLTSGHNELALSSSFSESLSKENIDYETINLMDYDAVPDDAACLFINAATSDFSSDDKDKVIDYLDAGGTVILVTGYTQDETPNLDEILAYMSISVVDGLVVEDNTDNYYVYQVYLLPNQASSTYTSGTVGEKYLFLPYAQGLLLPETDPDGVSYEEFLYTSDSAYSKTDLTNSEELTKAEGDIDGPFTLGVEATKELDSGTATMVVYGCEQMFTDDADSIVSGANKTVFTNTFSGMAKHDSSVSIDVKSYEVSMLTLSTTQILLFTILTVIVLPLGCLVAGFVIWLRRRKR